MAVKYDNVVFDTSALLNNMNLESVSKRLVTVPDVMREIKNDVAMLKFNMVPANIEIIVPLESSVNHIKQFATLTGDITALSKTDINVLALAYEFELKFCQQSHVRQTPITPISDNKIHLGLGQDSGSSNIYEKSDKDDRKRLANQKPGFFKQGSDTDNNEPTMNNGWITPGNIGQVSFEMQDCDTLVDNLADNINFVSMKKNTDNQEHKVVCAVGDFAMQNVLMHLGLHIVTPEARVMKKLRSYLLYCTTCQKNEINILKQFCDNCGYRTLRKVPYFISPDGKCVVMNRNIRPIIRNADISKTSTLNAVLKYGSKVKSDEEMQERQRKNRPKTQKTCQLEEFNNVTGSAFYSTGYTNIFSQKDTNSRSFQRGYHLTKNRRL